MIVYGSARNSGARGSKDSSTGHPGAASAGAIGFWRMMAMIPWGGSAVTRVVSALGPASGAATVMAPVIGGQKTPDGGCLTLDDAIRVPRHGTMRVTFLSVQRALVIRSTGRPPGLLGLLRFSGL